jgi:hypothetical protein
VVDVSGDGSENCNPKVPSAAIRDELAAQRVVINGLPILKVGTVRGFKPGMRTISSGGPGAFIMPAAGYADFARAIRRKFITEIAGLP